VGVECVACCPGAYMRRHFFLSPSLASVSSPSHSAKPKTYRPSSLGAKSFGRLSNTIFALCARVRFSSSGALCHMCSGACVVQWCVCHAVCVWCVCRARGSRGRSRAGPWRPRGTPGCTARTGSWIPCWGSCSAAASTTTPPTMLRLNARFLWAWAGVVCTLACGDLLSVMTQRVVFKNAHKCCLYQTSTIKKKKSFQLCCRASVWVGVCVPVCTWKPGIASNPPSVSVGQGHESVPAASRRP
jgi:hypothetical protein